MIKNIKKKYKLNPIELISYNKNNFKCKESIDVLDLIFSHSWNDWIISEIIKAQKLKYFIHKKIISKKIFTNKFRNKKKKTFSIK